MFYNILEHVEVSNKKSIKHTINQIKKQTKKENNKNSKKKPYIKNYGTPDRPPPAAAMLTKVPDSLKTAKTIHIIV